MTRLLPGIGSHQSARRVTDDWLTPPWILDALGPFDLDPCCPDSMPWRTADTMLTINDDGLSTPWSGTVWCNPPYSDVTPWLERMAAHGDGIALVFARTEIAAWRDHVWTADPQPSILFIVGRLHFHRPNGERAAANAGAPSALIAYGSAAQSRLHRAYANRLVAGALVENFRPYVPGARTVTA